MSPNDWRPELKVEYWAEIDLPPGVGVEAARLHQCGPHLVGPAFQSVDGRQICIWYEVRVTSVDRLVETVDSDSSGSSHQEACQKDKEADRLATAQ